MTLNPTSVNFKTVVLASVYASEIKEEMVSIIGLIQDGTNYQVKFSQDESLVGSSSFTELGIAMTKDGLITCTSDLLDGTVTIAGYINGVKYVGTYADGEVTLEQPVGD